MKALIKISIAIPISNHCICNAIYIIFYCILIKYLYLFPLKKAFIQASFTTKLFFSYDDLFASVISTMRANPVCSDSCTAVATLG